ncbi:MAG: MAPEG family protein [Rhodobacteraceae bacterium]|nr:MAPEG family protein [Paracoccaceae bacterium]
MDISLKIALFAMMAQVALTMWSIVSTGAARTGVLKRKELHIRDIALSTQAYPDKIKQLQNNMRNQFETPPIFYAAVLLAVALPVAHWGIAGAAVAYVLLRFWHRFVHVGSNNVILRFKVFVLGIAALTIMWIELAIAVLRL